jgi:hypothetical protein
MNVRIWHLALIAAAFGTIAAGSCATFLKYGPYPKGGPYALAFLASAVLAGGPLVLMLFRLWSRRQREAWPSGRQAALIGVPAAVLGVGGYIGCLLIIFARTPYRYWLLFVALIVASSLGFVVVLGAVELSVIGAVRASRPRSGAR